MWLRSGYNSSANNFLGFLEDTLSKLKNKTINLVQLDSGFYQTDILEYLESKLKAENKRPIPSRRQTNAFFFG